MTSRCLGDIPLSSGMGVMVLLLSRPHIASINVFPSNVSQNTWLHMPDMLRTV